MFSASQEYRLKYQHETIEELVNGLSEEQLRFQVNPGKWSAQQNIAHLTAYQPAFLKRLDRIQEENDPLFERYVAENDPLFAETSQKDVRVLVAQMKTDRNVLVAKLFSLGPEQLRHCAIHARYGKMDVPGWLEFFLLHEAHHLFTIFMLTADLRKTFTFTGNS